MLLKQIFKTRAGASKRATFENAHSDTHRYTVDICSPDGQTAYGPSWDDVPSGFNKATCVFRLRKTKK